MSVAGWSVPPDSTNSAPLFIVIPIVGILALPAVPSSTALDRRIGLSLLCMLLIPAIVPATLAADSVVGERALGTLEPVLTAPIRAGEFLLGKALAALRAAPP